MSERSEIAAVTGSAALPGTRRSQAKAARRAELIAAAARQMARRGFAAVRLEDIGAEAGVSGPAMYRHFKSKIDLLDQMLLDISERLHSGGEAVVAEGGAPADVLMRLIEFHIDVLVTKPDLITVQDRDLTSMTPEANRTVRSLQRRYVERWVDVLVEAVRGLTRDEARVRVHAGFGLLNSSPRLPRYPDAALGELLTAMALGALYAGV
ncbi:TetR/AcrR family transcriptional regulator [Gordonia sp. HY002]|uniref:TetR/AcrR family transcriptional regulator n=1 Tax=Gordonia zhenghanii TaxID=2911516 RepID=UPI001EF09F7F|nr:TetR family transcriptional regulator [Gordonia zhenghanii]MCF8568794.1 TetR/AcrR family transcriptional regulator [Gordonia zhenghanii]MCF8607962.1 TetR/AcrR family transcriptional regulator [Gordonia zhenghanii]